MPARNMKRNSHWMILIAAAAALTASWFPSSRVQLSFVSFGLEAKSDCSYDNVSIYDGTDWSAPLLGTFCGETLPDDVTSSGNTMFVRFKTDEGSTSDGFSIYYSVFIPLSVDGCFGSPAEMRGDSGTFGIRDDQTLNYMKCSWKIQGDPSTLVQLHFLNFDLVASTDCSTASVKIYDGNDRSAPLLHSFCGDTLPSDVTSSGNTVLVHFMHFKLNSANTYEGFKIHYSVFIPVKGCFGSPAEMRGNMGTFGINDDQNLNYMTCSWKIHVEPSKLVQLHFLSFDLVASTDCSTASVKIYDGIYESGPLLYSFCGDSLPGDVTSRTRGNTVLVQFKHNSANTYEGFRIYYSVFIPVEGCFDSPAEMRGDMGTFGISDDQTLNYMTCSWKIQVEHSKLVQLHFLHFDLVASTDCRTANVKIYDGNDALAPLLHSFCGDTLPGDVTSSGNTVLVYFKHDSDNTYNGFKIYYSVFIPVEGCFGSPAEMTGDMGTFGISDDQALSYMTCSWKIQVEPSKLVQLHFLRFDLLASTDCSTASVKVYDGNDTSAPLLHSFCGDSLPGDIMSSGNTVLVYFMHFKLGSANTYEGFTIYYSVFAPVEGCFGSPAETRGDVGTFGVSDDQTLNYMTCSWKIQVDPSKLVQLHFLSFDLVASTDCSTASIKIYDGNDTSAPLLHSFCGDNLPCNVTSSGNTVLVQFMHFKQHSANTYKGFKIYHAVFMPVEGCTDPPIELRGSKGTLGISEDHYHNNMRCGWRINVEPSKLVQLHFLSFGLLASTDCSTTSIKIYDGNDPSAPLLRSFCGDSLPGDTISSGNTMLVYFKTGCSNTSGGFSIYYSAFTPVEGAFAVYRLKDKPVTPNSKESLVPYHNGDHYVGISIPQSG
ncbi:Cubilin [Lamellibrachia satsuma]|nr:Cubilin [Lamellibrachia satsuma]